MSERDELIELVSTAFDRTPPLSARWRSWFRLDLLPLAAQRSPWHEETAGVSGLVAPIQDPANPVRERAGRLWVATQRYSYRLEWDWRSRDGHHRTSAQVSDGSTTWSPTYSGEYNAGPVIPDAFPARNLLDPSWLVHYDWETPVHEVRSGWDTLAIQARLNPRSSGTLDTHADPDAPIVLRQRPPAEADVLVDAERGFLHRMTGLIDGQAFVVEELMDLQLDLPVDESMFRVDPSEVRLREAT